IWRQMGSDFIENRRQGIRQHDAPKHDIFPIHIEELALQVVITQAQVLLERGGPMATILRPSMNEDAIDVHHQSLDQNRIPSPEPVASNPILADDGRGLRS